MTNPEMNPRFFVKSFFADSVPDAMDQARQELGPDALLLNTKTAPPEARHLGEFEVVFGEYADAIKPPEPPPSDGLLGNVGPQCAPCLQGLRHSMREILAIMAPNTGETTSPPERHLARVVGELMEAGVDLDLADTIAASVGARMKKRAVADISRPYVDTDWDDATVADEMRSEIAARCVVKPEIGNITAFVGPPGAGKTTTLVKLAVSQGLAQRKPVRLLSVDTHRVGASAQLETFANIIGVPFQAVESPAALAHAIDYAPANTILLIDTPGYSATLFRELGYELARLFAHRQEIDTHLVLTASMRPEAIRQAADLYGAFRPSKLLFTHLDEESSFPAIFCEAARRELPLSFFSTGQSIPEDIEPATVHRITNSLVRQLPRVLQAVA